MERFVYGDADKDQGDTVSITRKDPTTDKKNQTIRNDRGLANKKEGEIAEP